MTSNSHDGFEGARWIPQHHEQEDAEIRKHEKIDRTIIVIGWN
jgi:hypothetical protein